MKKNIIFIVISFVFLGNAQAGINASKLMKNAQTALSAADYKKAFALYSKASKTEKDPLADFILGLFFKFGWGRSVDEKVACEWFEKSAPGGIPAGQHFTAVCLEKGLHRPADLSAAAYWYEKAAKGGHSVSNCYLGNLYMNGNGVAKDPGKALRICFEAAQKGGAAALLWMGKFLFEGDESVRNPKEALKWFEAAAQNKEPEAFYYLGLMISNEDPQEHDTSLKARAMFEQAAALGYVPAYFLTGKLHFYAEPNPETKALLPEDLALAYQWLSATVQRSTAETELDEAKKMLAQILELMPKTWVSELDARVAAHLKNH